VKNESNFGRYTQEKKELKKARVIPEMPGTFGM